MNRLIWGSSLPCQLQSHTEHTCLPQARPPFARHSCPTSSWLVPAQTALRPRTSLQRTAAVAEQKPPAESRPAAPQLMPADQKATWYAVVANSDFMLHDVQNESFAEQLRERRRLFAETNKDMNFFLVPEPAWLDSKFPNEGKRVGRPSLAVVSPDKQWITFMKLRLDRVLRLDLGEMSREEVTKSVGKLPEYGPLDKSKWTAPYAPYRPGWWEMFMVKEQH